MAKEPRAGFVKSRLALGIGAAEAVRFYRVTLAATLRRLADPRWELALAVAPDTSLRRPFWPQGVRRLAQGPGDLGQRMQRLFDLMPPGPVVIVGSDIPDIATQTIARAFRRLGEADMVFGPAEDGGYWLVGARRRPRVPRPFRGVRWSGPHALADTCSNCTGLDIDFVATLNDVDTEADWRRWRRGAG